MYYNSQKGDFLFMGIILCFIFSALAVKVRKKRDTPLTQRSAIGYSLLFSTLCALASVHMMINFHFEDDTWEKINLISYGFGYVFTYFCSMRILQKK